MSENLIQLYVVESIYLGFSDISLWTNLFNGISHKKNTQSKTFLLDYLHQSLVIKYESRRRKFESKKTQKQRKMLCNKI